MGVPGVQIASGWIVVAATTAAAAASVELLGPAPPIVRLGEPAILTVLVEGPMSDVEVGPLPAVDGLGITTRAATTRRHQTIVDGHVVERELTSVQLELLPVRAGTLDVPPLPVKVGGAAHRTRRAVLEARANGIVTSGGPDATRAFVEVEGPSRPVFLRERFLVRVRFGLEARFATENLLPLFRRPLDLPVQVVAEGLDAIAGAARLAAPTLGVAGAGARGRALALGDGEARATRVEDRVIDGRRFDVYELERAFVPERSGDVEIPVPALRFALATRFDDDLFTGRIPLDRREMVVVGRPAVVSVTPLPEAGRPIGFRGAVGRFSIAAHVEGTTRVRAGEAVRLVVRIVGDGAVDGFVVPAPSEADGFHPLGVIEESDGIARTITYDLAPLHDGVDRLPPIRLAYFDPTPPGAYRTIAAAAIPLDVFPAEAAAVHGGGDARASSKRQRRVEIDDLQPVTRARAFGRPLSPAGVALVLLLPWIAAAAWLAWCRVRGRVRRAASARRVRAAVAACRTGADLADPRLGASLAELVAACLEEPVPAVVDPELASRLERAGLPLAAARRAAARLEAWIGAEYGGPTPRGRDEDRAVIHALEATFGTTGGRP